MPRNARSAALLVRQIRPSHRKTVKAGQHVVEGFCDVGMAGQPGTLDPHPGVELVDHRQDALLAHGEASLRRLTVGLALNGEDGVDPLHCLERDRRYPASLAQRRVGQFEELTTAMRPACCFGDRARPTRAIVEPVEAGIGVGLEDPGEAPQMVLRMLTATIGRVEEHCRR